jgi:hypothetical protein
MTAGLPNRPEVCNQQTNAHSSPFLTFLPKLRSKRSLLHAPLPMSSVY